MDAGLRIYLYAWIACCLLAGMFVLVRPGEYSFLRPAYWRNLFKPWKVTTFLIAAAGITLVAPYSGDPTWDYVDSIVMSCLVYATAPWAVGTTYRTITGKGCWRAAYVAACLWLFSASWFYDAWMLYRDGYYPCTWWPNLNISGAIYCIAGLLWNLDYTEGKGIRLAFQRDGWPLPEAASFKRIAWIALPLMGMAAFITLYMLWLLRPELFSCRF
jgi:hypothetical protein